MLRPRGHVYITTDRRLLDVDLRSRSVRPLLEGVEVESIGMVGHVLPPLSDSLAQTAGEEKKIDDEFDKPRISTRLAVRTPTRLLVLDTRANISREFRLPEVVKDIDVRFYSLGDNKALLQTQRKIDGQTWYDLYWIDRQGEITTQDSVFLASQQFSPNYRAQSWMAAAMSPAPLSHFVFSGMIMPATMAARGESASYATALRTALAASWQAFVVVALSSLALSWILARIQRGYFRQDTTAWAVTVFLLGPLGLLAYWLQFRRPVMEACGACRERVPRDRDACAVCSTDFPAAEPNGNEVFA